MKIGASTLIAVGILNAVHAAPAHEGDRLECRAIGKPGTLAAKDEFTYFNPRYMDMVDGTLKKLEEDLNSTGPAEEGKEELQFYECKAPSDKFKSTTKDVYFGQLRSANDEDKCLTTDGWWKALPGQGKYGGPGYKMEFDDGKKHKEDARVKYEKCSSKADDKLRFQWFAMTRNNKKNQNAGIAHAGHAKDHLAYEICPNDVSEHEKWKSQFAYFCVVEDSRYEGAGLAILKTKPETADKEGKHPEPPEW